MHAFHALVRIVRRSPNAYSLIGGILMLCFGPFYLAMLAAPDLAGTLAPSLFGAMQAAVARAIGSFNIPVVIMSLLVGCGLSLILMGLTRVFTPRSDTPAQLPPPD